MADDDLQVMQRLRRAAEKKNRVGMTIQEDDAEDNDTDSDDDMELDHDPNEDDDDEEEKDEASEPVCFGELGLLGIQKVRTASIVAHTMCHVRVLYRTAFMKALEDHSESLNMEKLVAFLKSRYDGDILGKQAPAIETLQSVPIFKEVGCSLPFLTALAEAVVDRIYLVGQKMVCENVDDDRSMYVIGQGSAKVYKSGQEVGMLSAGAVFGEVVLLGLATKRSSTIVAEEVCFAQVLQQKDVVGVMREFPEERQRVMMIALARNNSSGPSVYNEDGSLDWKANNVQSVIRATKDNKTFGSMGPEFIEELSTVAIDRIMMPGDLILEEGAPGDSLFIMISGQAKVYIRQQQQAKTARQSIDGAIEEQKVLTTRVGMLSAGGISGEVAMLGISPTRSATVEAETICVMWEICHNDAMPVIENHPEARLKFLDSVCSHLEHTVSNCMDGIALFSKFDRKFRMLLGLYCDRRAFFPGQALFREGACADGLYILNYGQATITKQSFEIKVCPVHSCFQCTVMLGTHKVCFYTVTATATCHVLIISRSSFMTALEQYPSDAAAKDMAKHQTHECEEFRESIRRLVSRGIVWNRSQSCITDICKITEKHTDAEILTNAWKKWWTFTLTNTRHRKELRLRKQSTQEWIKNRRTSVCLRQDERRTGRAASPMNMMGDSAPLKCLPAATQSVILSPECRVNKYTKMSSVYTGSGREWQHMLTAPQPSTRSQSSRSRQLPDMQGGKSNEFMGSTLSSPRTPRDARARALGRRIMGGSDVAIWPGGNRTCHLSWDAAEALGL